MLTILSLFILLISPISVSAFSISKSGFQPTQQIIPLYLGEAYIGEKVLGEELEYYVLSLEHKSMVEGEPIVISMIANYKTFSSMVINIATGIDPTQNLTQYLPTTSTHQFSCSDNQILTCVLPIVPQNSLILIGLQIKDPTSYYLMANLELVQTISVSQTKPTMNVMEFNSSLVNMFMVDMSQLDDGQGQDNDTLDTEVVVRVEYVGRMGEFAKFVVRAGIIDQQTGALNIIYNAQSLAAYSQVLKLPHTDTKQYYLVITSQSQATLSLITQIPSSYIQQGKVLQYIYDNSLQSTVSQISQFFYNVTTQFGSEQSNSNYAVYLEKLSGFGTVVVSACDFLHQFDSQNGESQYSFIPVKLLECIDNDIYISLQNITQKLGIRIIIQTYDSPTNTDQTTTQTETLYLSQQRLQIIDQGCTNYAIQSTRLEDGQQVYVYYSASMQDSNNIQLTTCSREQIDQEPNCCGTVEMVLQQDGEDGEYFQYYYMFSSLNTYSLNICPNNNTQKNTLKNYYTILAVPTPKLKRIPLDSQVFQMINCNQQYIYSFDLNKLPPLPQSLDMISVKVKVKVINGDIVFYQNCTQGQQQSNQDEICFNNDDETLRYFATYRLSQLNQYELFQSIKFGIRGLSQSLVSVITYLDQQLPGPDPPGPTPDPYSDNMLIDGQNMISTLQIPQTQGKIFVYKSHIIPYNVTPSYQLNQYFCVEIFTSLQQLEQNSILCSPDSWILQKNQQMTSDSLYLRISPLQPNKKAQFPQYVQLDIIIPTIMMQNNNNMVISCYKFCYAQLKVNSFDGSTKTYVTAKGNGYLNQTADQYQSQLVFVTPPFIFTATLPTGGILFIQTSKSQPLVINKTKTTYQVNKKQQLSFIYPIQKYSNFAQILLKTFGSRLFSQWKLFKFNKSSTNFQTYSYPLMKLNQSFINQTYSQTATSINFQQASKKLKVPELIPDECYQNEQIQCFLTVTVLSRDFDFINNDREIVISSNVSSYYLYINIPQTLQSSYGVIYARPLVLLNSQEPDNGFIIKQSTVTIQPLSSCGTLQANIAGSDVLLTTQNIDYQNYVKIYSTQPCTYNIAITSCEVPMLFSQTPRRITLRNMTATNQLLFTVTDTQVKYSLQIWKNFSIPTNQSTLKYPPIVVSIYRLPDIYDCSAQQSNLIYSQQLYMSDQSIYQTSLLGKQLLIDFPQDSASNIYLLQVSTLPQKGQQYIDSNIELNLILRSITQSISLLPNHQYIPSISMYEHEGIAGNQYKYYTVANDWELCYLINDNTGNGYNVSVKVVDSVGELAKQQVGGADPLGCLRVVKRTTEPITQYTITINIQNKDIQARKQPIIWLKTKQYIQSIQITHSSTLLHTNSTIIQPNTLQSPNGIYGKCYNFDLTSLDSTVYIVIYLDHPHLSSSNSTHKPSLYIPGTKLEYNVTEVINTKNQMLIGYKIGIGSDVLKEESISVCVRSMHGFYIGFIQESQAFMVLLNGELTQRKTNINNPASLSLQIFKYIQFANFSQHSNTTQNKTQSKYIVTQLAGCQQNINNYVLLGSTNIMEILAGNVADFQQVFANYSVQSALSVVQAGVDVLGSNLYVGVKSGQDGGSYAIKMYQVDKPQLPQKKWSLVGTKFIANLSQDLVDIIILLPIVNNTQPSPSLKPMLNYTIYIMDSNAQSLPAQKHKIRCPANVGQQPTSPTIFNISLQNPKTPLFKVKIDSLKPFTNVSIMASVTITESADQMPFTYYYNTQNLELGNGNDNTQTINLGILFLICGTITFVIVVFKIVSKVIRRRSSRNDIQFQLAEPTASTRNNSQFAHLQVDAPVITSNSNQNPNPNPSPVPDPNQVPNSNPNPNPDISSIASSSVNQTARRSQNSNTGYGEFVDEDQVTV